MTTRLLPPYEWPRLRGTELEQVWPVLPPGARIVVVEDGDAVVGCWALFPVWHVEGVWIAPAHRGKGAVARRLWTAMRRLWVQFGLRSVATAALTPDVETVLRTAGAVPLPGVHYAIPVERV